jgi:hypothetical protein
MVLCQPFFFSKFPFMNIRIKESCIVNGSHAESGTVLRDLSAATARELVISGRAVSVEDIETRDPLAEHRDPKPAKKGKA